MTPVLSRLLLAASLAVMAACASGRSSSQCKDICRRHATCVDQAEEARADRRARKSEGGEASGEDRVKFDQNECVAACTALERDGEGAKLVARHIACARKAADCTALLACP